MKSMQKKSYLYSKNYSSKIEIYIFISHEYEYRKYTIDIVHIV